jgi:hypothetical protein
VTTGHKVERMYQPNGIVENQHYSPSSGCRDAWFHR